MDAVMLTTLMYPLLGLLTIVQERLSKYEVDISDPYIDAIDKVEDQDIARYLEGSVPRRRKDAVLEFVAVYSLFTEDDNFYETYRRWTNVSYRYNSEAKCILHFLKVDEAIVIPNVLLLNTKIGSSLVVYVEQVDNEVELSFRITSSNLCLMSYRTDAIDRDGVKLKAYACDLDTIRDQVGLMVGESTTITLERVIDIVHFLGRPVSPN